MSSACSDDAAVQSDGSGGGDSTSVTSGGTAGSGGSGGMGGGTQSVEATDEDRTALEALAAITAAVRQHPEVWPAYNPAYEQIPILAVHWEERALLAKHPDPPAGLPVLAGLPPLVNDTFGEVYLAEGYEDALPTGAAFTLDVPIGTADNGFAIVYPVGKSLFEAFLLKQVEQWLMASITVHEMFHVYQIAQWQWNSSQWMCGYPLDDNYQLALSWIEQLALAEAIAADDPTARLGDFVAARLVRHNLDPSIALTENDLERIEGTASFVEHHYTAAAGMTDAIEVELSEDLLDGGFDADRMSRLRSYPVGATLALLLDELSIPYRDQLADGAFLSDIAAAALGIDLNVAQSALPQLEIDYQLNESVLPMVTASVAAYTQARQAMIDAYANAPGHRVHLEIGYPKNLIIEERYSLQDCTEYGEMTLTFDSEEVQARVTDSLVFIEPLAEGRRYSLASAETGSFTLDGAPQQWQPGTYPFQSLQMAFTSWEVSLQAPGELIITADDVTVRLLP